MGIENRRHQRLDIAIEVRVSGKDKNGKPFKETTLSGDISSGGCSLFLSSDLAAGSELNLEFLHYGAEKQEPKVLPFLGTVVRATSVNAAQYTVGIQFKDGLFPIDMVQR